MSEPKPWLVMKFGGTSVATAETWTQIAARAKEALPRNRVCIVASALSQVSNLLVSCLRDAVGGTMPAAFDEVVRKHRALGEALGLDDEAMAPIEALLSDLERLLQGIALTREASPKLEARVMSFGELASTFLGRGALQKHGLGAVRLDARDLLVSTDQAEDALETRYLEAEVQPRTEPAAVEALAPGAELVITQGFIAKTPSGDTCLLGRGGSDTSGALMGALLGAERIEIWTDVHGMFTADPRQVPSARLVRQIGFREAQELAAMGAKVLHPRAIAPARWARIPLVIRNTKDPAAPTTVISGAVSSESSGPAVMAVVKRTGVTLLNIHTLDMWGAHGFLAKVFQPFTDLGISVDLVATSQAAVSVTLDRLPGGIEGERFQQLHRRLKKLGEVTVMPRTAVVSIVGRRIRTVLHELGPAFAVFREHAIHLVSESSEDLNFSFVVDEGDADKLVASLHARLVPAQGAEGLLGPTWAKLSQSERSPVETLGYRWWRQKRDQLLELAEDGAPRFVYDLDTVKARATALVQTLGTLDRIYYAMKANSHPAVLEVISAAGIGLECVSAKEVEFVRTHLGNDVPILFTPNFCPVEEYRYAYEAGAEVTIDGTHVLEQAPEIFRGRKLALRLDPGEGLGHHDKVKTAGAHAKFGQPLIEAAAVATAAAKLDAKVVGLHAHVGSGILDPKAWERTFEALLSVQANFPDLEWIDLGGGLGVVERPGQSPLPLDAVERSLAAVAKKLPRPLALRMEPGRYLVSEAGVLLSPVTQVRKKGEVSFVGSAAGMSSLLRPALYGAWHGIHNLTRIEAPPAGYAHVVGPICETGDVLGRDRLLPDTHPGDILVIETCGAYGRVMSSSYNLRPPAAEHVLPLT